MGPYLGTEVVDVTDLGGVTLEQNAPKPKDQCPSKRGNLTQEVHRENTLGTDGGDQGDVSLHQVILKTATNAQQTERNRRPLSLQKDQLHWHCDLRFSACTLTNHKSLCFKLLNLPHLLQEPENT